MQWNRETLFLSLSPTDKLSAVCHHASKNRHTALGTGRMCCTISTADRFTSCAIVLHHVLHHVPLCYITFYTMCHCFTLCFTPCACVLHHVLHQVPLFYIFYTMCHSFTLCLHHVSLFYIVLYTVCHNVCKHSAIGTISKETPGQICCKTKQNKKHTKIVSETCPKDHNPPTLHGLSWRNGINNCQEQISQLKLKVYIFHQHGNQKCH